MNIVLLESLGIPQASLEARARPLREAGHTFAAYERVPDAAEQIRRAKDADALMIANMPLSGEVLRACGRLRFLDVAFTGVDHVDLSAAREMGVTVSNAAGYSTEAVAELTLCLMLSLLRNVPAVSERCRAGGTKEGLVGSEARGKTVGVVGVGAIGERVARLLHTLGCRVLGCRRRIRGDEPDFIELVPLEALLEEADIVTLHCPLTEETRGLIGERAMARMKHGAYLINCARGPVVDSAALAAALLSGHLAGAAADVFETEPPLPPDHPLLGCPNCLVTPHVAFATRESMEARADIVFGNLEAWMRGTPRNVVL